MGQHKEPRQYAVVHERWTPAQKDAFLGMLAATGNVAASCRAVNAFPASAYTARRNDPDFAVAWHAALQTGYDRLEEALLAKAGAAIESAESPMAAGEIDVELAMRLLRLHKGRARDGKVQRSRRLVRASSEEVDAELIRRLSLMRRKLRGEAKREAKNDG